MAKFQPDPPLVIGLLGGIAAGKSEVASLFANHGLVLLDADATARQVVARPEVRAKILAHFGPTVLAADGSLDRERLAAIVFSSPEERAAMEELTHPAIREALEGELARARAAGHSVVLDAPLLLEGGLIEHCDACVFVATSEETRRQRALMRGWDAGELARRESAQASLEVKKQRCVATIHGDRSISNTSREVAAVLAHLGGNATS